MSSCPWISAKRVNGALRPWKAALFERSAGSAGYSKQTETNKLCNECLTFTCLRYIHSLDLHQSRRIFHQAQKWVIWEPPDIHPPVLLQGFGEQILARHLPPCCHEAPLGHKTMRICGHVPSKKRANSDLGSLSKNLHCFGMFTSTGIHPTLQLRTRLDVSKITLTDTPTACTFRVVTTAREDMVGDQWRQWWGFNLFRYSLVVGSRGGQIQILPGWDMDF